MNTKEQKRTLFLAQNIQVREAKEGEEESRVIEGCAIVFNRETTLWDGKYYRQREMILPSCVTQEFLAQQDIKLNLLHNREDTLCRNNKGVGTLHLELRADGLWFRTELPKCDLGNRALELIKNQTYTGCSFEFLPLDYTEEVTTLPDGREDCFIKHSAFKSIDALTIAMDPAYNQTSVNVREDYQKRENDKEEAAKREAQAQADAEAQAKARREKQKRELAMMQSENDAMLAIENRVN